MTDAFFATNGLSAKNLFRYRSAYKNEAYPQEAITPLDFWYEDQLYGRLDRQGNSIYAFHAGGANYEYLTSNSIPVFDFAARNMFAMKEEYDRKVFESAGMVPLQGIKDFNVKAGVSDLETIYYDHIQGVKNYFIYEYLRDVKCDILNFDQFMEEFYKFALTNLSSFPITKTSFVLNRTAPPAVSGLIIDLDLGEYPDDSTKEFILGDKCQFIYFSNLAARYGFLIDKNAPWRLIIDINSPQVPTDLFERYFVRAYTDDITLVATFLLSAYDEFYQLAPSKRTRIYDPTQKSTMYTVTMMDYINYTVFKDPLFWNKAAAKVRLYEAGRKDTESLITGLHIPSRAPLNIAAAAINGFAKQYDKRIIKHYHQQAVTSKRDNHTHRYEVDENGNGVAYTENSHTHRIVDWRVGFSDGHYHSLKIKFL